MSIGGFRFRRSFGNVEGRRFRGARPAGFSPEAQNYFDRVEANGGTVIAHEAIASYIDSLVALGGGYWDDAAQSCIFWGVSIEGCFVPLRDGMVDPTNNNFVIGDHDPLSGLLGDGLANSIGTGVFGTDLPQDDVSASVFVSEVPTLNNGTFIGQLFNSGDIYIRFTASSTRMSIVRMQSGSGVSATLNVAQDTLSGASRSDSSGYTERSGGAEALVSKASTPATSGEIFIYSSNALGAYIDARLGAYHLSSSIDLSTLEGLQLQLKQDVIAHGGASPLTAKVTLLLGQSNAVGQALFLDATPSVANFSNSLVSTWGSSFDSFTQLDAQVNNNLNAGNSTTEYGVEIEIGQQYVADGINQYLIKNAANGSGLYPSELLWTPYGSGTLYNRIIDYIGEAITYFASVGLTPEWEMIWLQGEKDASNDSGLDADTYYQTDLTALISGIRTAVGDASMPVVLCSLTNLSPALPQTSKINTAFTNIAGSDSNITLLDTSLWQKDDGIHYDATGITSASTDIYNALNP